jgi:hypothetical protein
MRLIVTGVDAQGRSTVVDERPFTTDPVSVVSATVFSTGESPPALERPLTVPARPQACPPGTSLWQVYSMPPNAQFELHRTNTLDYDHVLAGSASLILETGEVGIGPGDCVVVADVVHGFRVGPDGLVLSVMFLGLK